jgi:hypothetical protein
LKTLIIWDILTPLRIANKLALRLPLKGGVISPYALQDSQKKQKLKNLKIHRGYGDLLAVKRFNIKLNLRKQI